MRPSDRKLATNNTGTGGLLIDDLDLSKREDNAAYNPNPFSIAKINAVYRRQTGTLQSPVRPVRPSDSDQNPVATTNTGAAGLLNDDLDLSEREDNGAYNPSIAKINIAASRPCQTSTVNGPVVQTTQSVMRANKPTQAQRLTKRSRTNSKQTTIMEGFKTQALKKPRINALQSHVPTSNPISPNSNLAVNKPPAGLIPSASLISSPSPKKPSNHLEKKRILPDDSSSGFMQVKSYPKRDAYQYSTEDLDEEWTTLPSKKKKQRKPKFFPTFFCHYSEFLVNIFFRTGNPTFTKSFHIPGLRLPTTTRMKTETIATTSTAPKMTMYLPPPLKFVDVKRPTSNKNSGHSNGNELSMKETEDRKRGSPSSDSSPTNYFYTDAYPSPSRSSSKLSLSFPQAKRDRNCTPPRSRPGVRVVPMVSYRPPSPPTSDLPIPSDADIHVEVDQEGIQLRYPEMKRLSRKVLCSYFVFSLSFFNFYI